MGKVNLRQENPQAGVKYTVINISDDRDPGTGSFTSVFDKDAVDENRAIESTMVNAPAFVVSVTMSPATREILAQLGRADGSDPRSRKVYELPAELDSKGDCNVDVEFNKWMITSVTLNNMALDEKA